MAVSFSFKAIVGSPCFHNRLDQSKSVNEALLLSCVKDIEMRRSNRNFNILPLDKARAFNYFLCPGSGEFDPCLGGVAKIESEV